VTASVPCSGRGAIVRAGFLRTPRLSRQPRLRFTFAKSIASFTEDPPKGRGGVRYRSFPALALTLFPKRRRSGHKPGARLGAFNKTEGRNPKA
jgi:hypothetical protein